MSYPTLAEVQDAATELLKYPASDECLPAMSKLKGVIHSLCRHPDPELRVEVAKDPLLGEVFRKFGTYINEFSKLPDDEFYARLAAQGIQKP